MLHPIWGCLGDARSPMGVFGGGAHTSLILPHNSALPHPRAHLTRSPRVLQKIPPGPPQIPSPSTQTPSGSAGGTGVGLGSKPTSPSLLLSFALLTIPKPGPAPISHRIGHGDGETPPELIFSQRIISCRSRRAEGHRQTSPGGYCSFGGPVGRRARFWGAVGSEKRSWTF